MRIVFLETIEDARAALMSLSHDLLTFPQTVVFSLDPKIESFLISQKIPCENTLKYFDNESHQSILLKTERILQKVLLENKLKDEHGLTNTYRHLMAFHLKFQMNYFFVLLEILRRLYQLRPFSEIYVANRPLQFRSQTVIQQQEGLLCETVRRFCEAKRIEFKTFKLSQTMITQSKSIVDHALSFFCQQYFRLYAGCVLKFNQLKCSYVLVPTWGYKFDLIIKRIKKENPNVKVVLVMCDHLEMETKRKVRLFLMSVANYLPFLNKLKLVDVVLPFNLLMSPSQKQNDGPLFELLSSMRFWEDPDIQSQLETAGVSFADLIAEKFKVGFREEVLRIEKGIGVFKKFIAQQKPKLLLSPYSAGFYYALGELSQLTDFESCTITHGTHVPPGNEYERIENYWLSTGVVFNDYKTVALQTPWHQRFMEYYQDYRQSIVTGPLVLSQCPKPQLHCPLKKELLNISTDTKVVLYATTQKISECNRLYITETLDEFIDSLKDIVDAINQSPNLHLLIRPHPLCELDETDFKRLLPHSSKMSVMASGRFEDVLSLSDLLVSFSSTCIEESLINERPVILYDKWNRYNHFNVPPGKGAVSFQQKPVVYVSSVEKLKIVLNEFALNFIPGTISPEALKTFKYDEPNDKFDRYVKQCLKGV